MEPVNVPRSMLRQGTGGIDAYACFHAVKPHASGREGRRAVILTSAFLWMLNYSGKVVKVMPLDALVRVEYDARKGRALFVGDDTTADWLLEFKKHRDNQPDSFRAVFHAVNTMRRSLEKVQSDLPLEDNKVSSSLPTQKPRARHILEKLDAYEKGALEVPRTRHGRAESLMFHKSDVASEALAAPSSAQPPSSMKQSMQRGRSTVRRVFRIVLDTPDDHLGIGFLPPDPSEGESVSDAEAAFVRVAEVVPGSAAAKSGIVPCEVLTINGARITTIEEVHAAVKRMRKSRGNVLDIEALVGPSIRRRPSAAVSERLALPHLLSPPSRRVAGNSRSVPTSAELYLRENSDPLSLKDPVIEASRAVLISVTYVSDDRLYIEGGSQRLFVMSEFLQRKGYLQQIILTDEPDVEFNRESPSLVRAGGVTRRDILRALDDVAVGLTEGESVFLYVSAYGPNVPLPEDYPDCAGIENISFYTSDLGEQCITCQDLGRAAQRVIDMGCSFVMFSDFYYGGSAMALPWKIELPPWGTPMVAPVPPEEATPMYPGKGRAIAISMLSLQEDVMLLKSGLATNCFLRAMGGTAPGDSKRARRNPSFLDILRGMRSGVEEDDAPFAERIVPLLEYSHQDFLPHGVCFCDGIHQDGYRAGEETESSRPASLYSHVDLAESVGSGGSASGLLASTGKSLLRSGSYALRSSQRGSYCSRKASNLSRIPSHLSQVSRVSSRQDTSAGAKGPTHPLPLPPWLLGEHNGLDLLHTTLPGRVHEGVKPVVAPQFRQRLIAYYRYYNPERLDQVTSMLIQYKGKEDHMFELLAERYGPEPHLIVEDKIPQGWTKVMSPKGEVFYRHDDGRRQWEVPVEDPETESTMLPPAPGFRPEPGRRKKRV